ncbi:hypothetical protein [Streptomyces sp. NPDC005969]|uniref:hypothetical protein n=1 Tax=Streptomyces sp. NPDC005969 TaxID=3156722 RepID=UPI0033C50A00
MNVAIGISAFGATAGIPATEKGAACFAVELSERHFGGPGAGVWMFTNRPVAIPAPGAGEIGNWANQWLTLETPEEWSRGEEKNNGLARLREDGRLFSGTHDLAPVLKRIISSSSGLSGHTLAMVVLTGPPHDGADFIRTVRRAARYPVFWVFIGTGPSIEPVVRLGAVETIGSEPGDPDNFVIVKTRGWSAFTKWRTGRRIRRAVTRWQRRTPTG